MKDLSKEKLSLLILLIILFITGSGIFLWQGFNNNRVISSVAVGQYRENENIYSNNKSGDGNNESQGINSEVDSREYGNSNNSENKVLDSSADNNKEVSILVHVAGEVVNPGVYQLAADSRVVHAVEAAGGATTLADLNVINLASQITDGQKIYVPSVLEDFSQNFDGNTASTAVSNSSSKININTASSDELQELSGIGPSKAGSIIDYRDENGPFKKVDELLNVSGIGEKTLEKIKDDIVVK